ncbi:barstar family protein [Streptomyces sp. NBC_00264]|uniref:barstar family protein n=1 Tax=unclassified Streptomyces TaxID=2593676 RepID=UPI000F5C043D|nr:MULTISPECIES: barstar family protein [unclassified Streptomyces]WSG55582.1 barstar family protein [Streptomyces sp. NBC_01732]WSX06720.1 barstar family protein [Streptomyces sp. NBC_00987]MCX4391421.1 barstar family protein [Streptomyces sp. NBC_01767]MCX5165431.1 barstar family protein [Streptomyces sp. NBC_00305]MCX5223955.1 barstar family protein [Streptomyces sp. NBC_00264]
MAVELPVAAEVDFPLYVVSDEESEDVLVAAEGVEGFFVDPEEESSEVAFLGAREVERGRRRVENAVLEVTNRQREKIGEYFIGQVVLSDTDVEKPGENVSRVAYRFFGNRCEYPEAERIWPRWASGIALEKGEWLRWPVNYQSAWLHVVQNSWFATNRRAARYGVEDVVHLDGAQISTKSGFFCALGEAVNGPGGYFGSNLDALADCISSSFGEGPPVRIVWRNFQASREYLDDAFLDSIVRLMREFRVDLATC